MTKAKIRASARAAGLFTADKPAYACLATRVPTGEPITYAALQCIEQAEDVLDRLGFSDYRVRLYHGAARIQLPKAAGACDRASTGILTALQPSFEAVLLDLQPRPVKLPPGKKGRAMRPDTGFGNFKTGAVRCPHAGGRRTETENQAPLRIWGFAKVDHHRGLRQGVPEVIYGAGGKDASSRLRPSPAHS